MKKLAGERTMRREERKEMTRGLLREWGGGRGRGGEGSGVGRGTSWAIKMDHNLQHFLRAAAHPSGCPSLPHPSTLPVPPPPPSPSPSLYPYIALSSSILPPILNQTRNIKAVFSVRYCTVLAALLRIANDAIWTP